MLEGFKRFFGFGQEIIADPIPHELTTEAVPEAAPLSTVRGRVKRPRPSVQHEEQVRELFAKGHSFLEIASQLGISGATVSSLLFRAVTTARGAAAKRQAASDLMKLQRRATTARISSGYGADVRCGRLTPEQLSERGRKARATAISRATSVKLQSLHVGEIGKGEGVMIRDSANLYAVERRDGGLFLQRDGDPTANMVTLWGSSIDRSNGTRGPLKGGYIELGQRLEYTIPGRGVQVTGEVQEIAKYRINQ